MRFITLKEILILHKKIIDESGGSHGIRDIKLLESALAQPFMMFDGKYLYKTIIDKASSLGYSLIMNHPFVDGNKRAGHAAMEIFLNLNGYEIFCDETEQEKLILKLADGKLTRNQFNKWLKTRIIKA